MRRPSIGTVVVLMPSGFTLLNLCLGLLAIINAFAGDLSRAGLFVVLGGVADSVDGRVARATRTGSRFGEELDSLADFLTFGVAPALIMYTSVLQELHWLWAFIFCAAAAIRLARFNVEQAGKRKSHFYGLPSPAAGMTLATYYWFSQTDLYGQSWIGELPWQTSMRVVMVVLAVLMMSNVQYPKVPSVGFRSARGLMGLGLVTITLVGVAFFPREFFFPALVLYVAYGLVKTAVIGLMERRVTILTPPDSEIEVVSRDKPYEPKERSRRDDESAAASAGSSGGQRPRRRRRRRGSGSRGGSGGSGTERGGNPAASPPQDGPRGQRPGKQKGKEVNE